MKYKHERRNDAYGWHILEFTFAEADKLMMNQTERDACRFFFVNHFARGYTGFPLRQDVDEWLRTNFGHRRSERFEIDRTFYPDEVLPIISDYLLRIKREHITDYPPNTYGWSFDIRWGDRNPNLHYLKIKDTLADAGIASEFALRFL